MHARVVRMRIIRKSRRTCVIVSSVVNKHPLGEVSIYDFTCSSLSPPLVTETQDSEESMGTEILCWHLLALLVLTVSWRSEGVQNKLSRKRLRSFHEDSPELIVDQQEHSLVEQIQVSTSHTIL